MVYLFRIPPWYKLTALTIYSVSGYIVFDRQFQHLSTILSFTICFIFSIIGFWIIAMWRKNVVVNTIENIVRIGGTVVGMDDVKDVVVKLMSVRFILRSGDVISFRYPLENAKDLEKILKGVNA